MKPLPWTLLGLVLLLPLASAQPDPTRESVTAIQIARGVLVVDRIDWEVPNGTVVETRAHFWVPAAARDITFSYYPNLGVRQDVPAPNVTKLPGGEAGFDLYRVDFGTQPSPPTGGGNATRYTVSANYSVDAQTVSFRTWYRVGQLAVIFTSQPGFVASSSSLQDLQPLGYNTFHTARTGVAPNTTFDVSYVAAPGQSRDMTKYLWAGGGLLAGVLVAYVAVRQGWMAPAAKAKKFVKGGALESRGMLEARRRTLLAALKELEQAHEAKEVPDDAYAPLKEEYKAQAVRVMRTLEEKKESS